jgi:hypothetical protein
MLQRSSHLIVSFTVGTIALAGAFVLGRSSIVHQVPPGNQVDVHDSVQTITPGQPCSYDQLDGSAKLLAYQCVFSGDPVNDKNARIGVWITPNQLLDWSPGGGLEAIRAIFASTTPYSAEHAPISFNLPPRWYVLESTYGQTGVDGFRVDADDTIAISPSDNGSSVLISYYVDPDGSRFHNIGHGPLPAPAPGGEPQITGRDVISTAHPDASFVETTVPVEIYGRRYPGIHAVWFVPVHGAYYRVDTTLALAPAYDAPVYAILSNLHLGPSQR